MNCTHCQKEIPDDSIFCSYCGKAVTQIKESASTAIGSADVKERTKPDEPTWGIHLNSSSYSLTKNYPSWLNRSQKDNWSKRGVIIWDKAAQQVTKLWASHALQVLEELRSTEGWKEDGIVVGEPAMQFTLLHEKKKSKSKEPEKESKGEWVLTNQIELSIIQAEELHKFLMTHENALKEIAQALFCNFCHVSFDL